LIDVNRDGRYELCLAEGGRLHALDGKGQIIWTWDNPNVGRDILGPPQAYDIDGDGFVDFFVADEAGYLYKLTHEGRLVWSSHPCSNTIGQPTIADIDRDGGCELLVASWDGWRLQGRSGGSRPRPASGARPLLPMSTGTASTRCLSGAKVP